MNLFNLRNKNLLEIGCGGGVYTKFLKRYNKVIPTDIKKQNLENFVQADAHNLPFEDNTFDVVFGGFVLHHLKDLDKAIKNFKRVLKSNGLYCGIEPNGKMFYLYKLILNLLGKNINLNEERPLYPKQVENIFLNNGFVLHISFINHRLPIIRDLLPSFNNKFLSTCMVIKARKLSEEK